MGWRSDWLYRVIFDEVEKIWKRAKKDGADRFGPPPTRFLISELPEADWDKTRCHGDACRQWTYHGGIPELTELIESNAIVGEQRGMFFEQGLVDFFIDGDRRRVLFTYTLGPRYGRGMIFEVVGQGEKGKLTPCAGPAWAS